MSILIHLTIGSSLPVCKQGENCMLPDCFCSTFKHPLDLKTIPQMVYFGFDKGAKAGAEAYYNRLFRHERKNPNDCPISLTLFVSDANKNFDLITEYYNRGFEIAILSSSHHVSYTVERLKAEAKTRRYDITSFSNITGDKIRGWKSTRQQSVRDAQIEALRSNNLTYDVSFPYTRKKMTDLNPWPFTLDYGWTLPCEIQPCPTEKHPGFWVVPVNAMRDYGDWGACRYFDSCVNKPLTVNQTYTYIMDNFRSHYHGNRAPFGIHMHEALFSESAEHIEAMDLAIQDLLRYDDVYIVDVNQVIEWMNEPTELQFIRSFKPWSCTSQSVSAITLPGILIFSIAILCIFVYIRVMTKLSG
ncbi:chitin deacetylase 8-like [Ylistrum balloti]|uniref:chitin deacetylase 8-like n=1 Tax=Ylistrum balloti TaxID=509963 RepID=UPI0029059075|nr:chitin deacetylase 8-like [Ylistrum balloti]